MGVHGLWRLIEPSGKPVPLETLENKILAVDVSIWLHQAVKGFQDSKGAPVPNAHLLGIYHRVCKLLYFKIKPVFIFDGGVPALKKQTIAKRNQQKSKNVSEAERLQNQLISTLLKHSAISKVLSEKTKASLTIPTKKTDKHENMYALPSSELDSTISSSEEESTENTTDTNDSSPTKHWDVHTIDMSSTNFKSLPVDVRHEILTELKETRKQNSWGKLHELPKQSDDFSSYQMKRLLKRQAVQSALEDAEKEMGGHSLSLAELESILKDHGVATTNDIGKRIASDENTRYLYIKDVKQALEKARQKQLKLESIREEVDNEDEMAPDTKHNSKADLEFEEDLEKAIALSLQEEPSTSKADEVCSSSFRTKFSYLENFNDADFESDVSEDMEDVTVTKTYSSAKSYMVEYSGLTPNEIDKILNCKRNLAPKTSKGKNTLEKKVANIEIVSYSDNNKHKVNKDLCLVSSTTGKNLEFEEGESSEILEIVVERSKSIESSNSKTIKDSEINSNIHRSDINTVTTAAAETTVTDDVTELSDGDMSSDIEFEEVSEETISRDKDIVKIVIDPSQKLKSDALIDDTFNKNDTKKNDVLEIIINPQTELDDDLFGDVFEITNIEENKRDKNNEKSETENNGSNSNIIESKISTLDQNICTRIPDSGTDTTTIKNTAEPTKHVVNNVTKSQQAVETEVSNLNLEDMRQLKHDLQKEKIDILVEKSVKERMASNITDQMYQEAQNLLELFGVPYIVAPMEAEAQCAFLDAIELTDGTITDDSDIWLFGGRTVYKNFFNQSKFVMEFKSENIKHHFKLTREQLILLALLVGSDYTVGLQGVGPVTALEILAVFPPAKSKEFTLSHVELLSGLKEFRSWFNKGKSAGPGRSALKNKLKNMAFTENFPSLQVVQAYLEPAVETSREKFSWSKPDFIGLREFAKEKFGWSPKKTEEIIKPVIKKVEENRAQKSIKDYFKTVCRIDSTDNAENQMSKRVKSAIKRIGKSPEELINEEIETLSKKTQKNSRTRNKASTVETKKTESQDKPKRSRKKKIEDMSATCSKSTLKTDENEKEPKPKKLRGRSNKVNKNDVGPKVMSTKEISGETAPIEEECDDLKKYENIAVELRKRRQRRNELSKKDVTISTKIKPPLKTTAPLEIGSQDLELDEEIQLLKATASRSLKRVEEIDQEVKNEMDLVVKKQCLPNIHKKEIIHQKLRQKSDLLENKLKAIEVFRKSKKGPGYVSKRGKSKMLPKKDAGLSESSDE